VKTEALKGVSLDFSQNGFVVINGKSGSGKTTLLNILCGLDYCSAGDLFLNGKKINTISSKEWSDLRNSLIGIVFQENDLLDEKSVKYNLEVVLDMLKIDREEYNDRIDKVLDLVGVGELKNKIINELSAGQKQRVSIARAVIKEPAIIFADEATGNLDPDNTEAVLELFEKISGNCLVVLVSHNKYAIEKYADRIITLEEGNVISDVCNEKKKYLYQHFCITDDQIKESIMLAKFDIGEYLCQNVDFTQKEVERLELKIEKVKKEDTKEKNGFGKRFEIYNPKISDIVRQGIHCYKQSPKKCILGLLLASLIMMFSLIGIIINLNDYFEGIADYLKKNEITNVTTCITNPLGGAYKKGYPFEKELSEVVPSDKLYKYKTVEVRKKDSEMLVSVAAVYNDLNILTELDSSNESRIIEGNRVIVSSALASKIGIGVNDEIYINDDNCKVSGIFDNNECIVCSSKELINPYEADAKQCAFPGIDITLSTGKQSYAESFEVAGKASSISDDAVIYGRKPSKDNEVMLSEYKAIDACEWPEKKLLEYCRLFDLYSINDGLAYTDSINLYDICGNNVQIVGVYSCDKQGENAGDIIFSDNVFEHILKMYTDHLGYEGIMVLCSEKEWYSTIKNMYKKEIIIEDDRLEVFYDSMKMMKEIRFQRNMVIMAFLCMLIISLLMVITYSIYEKKRRIGILMALGMRNDEIAKHLILENVLKIAFVSIVSLMTAFACMRTINGIIQGAINDSNVVLFGIEATGFFACFIAIILVAVLMMVIPTVSILNKKPIDLLKSD
jgi:ABC-type lipoprotein export system ATPase subunit/ABC-type lipoprotein release transport system permease subunit